jgi:DNA-binding CsgD family transcriptional regulator
MKRDVVGIVEAAYALDRGVDAWFDGVVHAATPLLDRGLGVLAWQYDASDAARIRTGSQRHVGGTAEQRERMLKGLSGSTAEMSERQNEMAYLQPGPVRTVSEIFGGRPREQPGFGHHLVAMGAEDALVVMSQDPSRRGCALTAPLLAVATPPKIDVSTWSRVAAHVAAGYRMQRLGSPEDDVAVLTPAGRVEHAEGAARTKTARDTLREAARRIDRARSKARSDVDEALALWNGLVAGRWSLVDRFDTDGRRFVVVRENAPEVADPRALSERERQVLAYAALGHPLKLTAYELGLSLSSVAQHRSRAMRKLGLRSQTDVARTFGPLAAAGGPRT